MEKNKTEQEVTSYKLACVIARILDEKLGKDITILNISNVSSFADYFVIRFVIRSSILLSNPFSNLFFSLFLVSG